MRTRLAIVACLVSVGCLLGADGLTATGSSTGAAVRIRQEPSLEAKQVGSLSQGEEVKILARSKDKTKIEALSAYWYRIRTASGIVGWSYGYYIDADPDDLATVDVIPPIDTARFRVIASGIGKRAYFYAACLQGSTLLAASSRGLEVFDCTDPADPQFLKLVPTTGHAVGLAVSGDYAYLLTQTVDRNFTVSAATLDIVAVKELRAASIVKSVQIPQAEIRPVGTGTKVWAGSGVLLVVGGTKGLHVLDVKEPRAASIVKTLSVPGGAFRVAGSGTRAYVAGSGRVSVVDLTNPRAASIASTIEIDGGPGDVAADGEVAYLSVGTEVWLLDASVPASPSIKWKLEAGAGYLGSVAVSGKRVYGVGKTMQPMDPTQTVVVVDVSNGASPTVARRFSAYGPDVWRSARMVLVGADHAYLASGIAGIRLVDLADTSEAPDLRAVMVPGARGAEAVAVKGSYAFVAGAGGLDIIDVSRPSSPAVVRTIRTEGDCVGVGVGGDHAFLLEGSGELHVLDVAEPRDASVVTTIPGRGYGADVSVKGRYAYDVGSSYSRIIDITNPAAPVVLRELTTVGTSIRAAGDLMFTTNYTGLSIDRISNPRAPAWVSTVQVPAPAEGTWGAMVLFSRVLATRGYVYVGSHLEYLGEGSPCLHIVDVSMPASASVCSTVDVGDVFDVAVGWGYAFAAGGDRGVDVIDITNPRSARLVRTIPTPAPARRVVAYENRLYVTAADEGLLIIGE